MSNAAPSHDNASMTLTLRKVPRFSWESDAGYLDPELLTPEDQTKFDCVGTTFEQSIPCHKASSRPYTSGKPLFSNVAL